MKKLIVGLIAVIPLLGCASSQSGYGGGGGGAAYFYGDCLYLEDCYDGYYRNNYYAAYPDAPTLTLRQSVEQVRNRHATRVVDRSGGGSSSGWAAGSSSEGSSSRASVAPSSSGSHGTTSVAPRDSSPPPAPSAPAPVSRTSSNN